jgi:hypothetical protein
MGGAELSMNNFYEWAKRWGIPDEAVYDYYQEVTLFADYTPTEHADSEAGVSKRARLQAAQGGDILWRNNVGAFIDPNTNRQVRYGLANESKRINERVKSSDLIGIRQVRITQDMVGQIIGQFQAIETKRPDWVWKGTDREKAQLRFHEIVMAHGGHARFLR